MAILYGTTGDGTTLPVLVDQFGNLLAKGIDGEPGTPGLPGPPGPPGVGELPPDPYEGALLGWESGKLAWVGGSVPLPAGTFGPFLYDSAAERLDVPQDASSLVKDQQLYMSNEKGESVIAAFSTDPIKSVAENTTPATFIKYAIAPTDYPGTSVNDVTGSVVFNQTWNVGYNLTIGSYIIIDTGSTYAGCNIVPFASDAACSYSNDLINWTQSAQSTGSNTYTEGRYYWIQSTPAGYGGGLTLQSVGVDPSVILSFDTAKNFGRFEVGDIVQPGITRDSDQEEMQGESEALTSANQVYSITDIKSSAVPPTITVNGGSWLGTDGSGTPGGQTDITDVLSGQGSVSMGFDGAILLRVSNGEWVDGYYVTAPEQSIAARKLFTTAIKRTTK